MSNFSYFASCTPSATFSKSQNSAILRVSVAAMFRISRLLLRLLDASVAHMNGAESLARTLVAGGVDTCFASPGASEVHFVSALDRVAGLRCVLGLAETAVAGFADGYGRMAGKPAATLFHCGPGLANAVANLHNARRGFSPIVNIVGDQATYHQPHDAPLTFQTETLAKTMSKWVKVAASVKDVGTYAAEAIQAARRPPCGNATLVLPADCAWDEGGEPGKPLAP